MDTRQLGRLACAVLLAAPASCVGVTRYGPGSISQVADGEAERFGPGLTLARPGSVILDLETTAYVVIARFGAIEVGELVYPLEGPDWLEFGYPAFGAPALPLAPGQHRLDLPLPWLRVDAPPVARRAALGDPCRYKDGAWACSSWAAWRYQENNRDVPYYSRLPSPDSLAEHHLVVLLSTKPFDRERLLARLDELHVTRVSPTTAASAAPSFLTAQHEGSWGSYSTTLRIQGVR
jgi:hypothetical protein